MVAEPSGITRKMAKNQNFGVVFRIQPLFYWMIFMGLSTVLQRMSKKFKSGGQEQVKASKSVKNCPNMLVGCIGCLCSGPIAMEPT